MEILNKNSTIPQKASLILGFFDGIHAGHQRVLKNTSSKGKRIVVTFSKSPADFFNKKATSIYPRQTNYKLLEEQGIDYIYEQDFAKISNVFIVVQRFYKFCKKEPNWFHYYRPNPRKYGKLSNSCPITCRTGTHCFHIG